MGSKFPSLFKSKPKSLPMNELEEESTKQLKAHIKKIAPLDKKILQLQEVKPTPAIQNEIAKHKAEIHHSTKLINEVHLPILVNYAQKNIEWMKKK